MKRVCAPGIRCLLLLVFAVGCTNRNLASGEDRPDAAADLGSAIDLATGDLAGCRRDKFKFTGCQNDGSVEFCAPTALAPTLMSLAPNLRCQPGGGRAQCSRPDVWLCTYPTAPPRECDMPGGALTPT